MYTCCTISDYSPISAQKQRQFRQFKFYFVTIIAPTTAQHTALYVHCDCDCLFVASFYPLPPIQKKNLSCFALCL